MPRRKEIFANKEVYHIFNRGYLKAPIFNDHKDYQRFLDLLNYYRFNPKLSFSRFQNLDDKLKKNYWNKWQEEGSTLEILTFCLMPNHYHLLLEQTEELGIKTFLSNLQNSYAKYFNILCDRTGNLFHSRFKAVKIETDEQLLHVSRYIHLNPTTSYLIGTKDIFSYRWSSLPEYFNSPSDQNLTKTSPILGLIGGLEKYKEFIFNQLEYQRELAKIKHLTLEDGI